MGVTWSTDSNLYLFWVLSFVILFIWKLHQVHFVFLLIVFALCLFFMILSGFNLYCWKGIHFSWSNSCLLLLLHIGLIFAFHFWFRDLLRELAKKYEVLLMVLFLVFFLFLASEALLFVSFFWASFHSLSSPTLNSWPGEGFYLPDPCELTFANTLLL